ncbi:Polyketide cyclase / dehydrase and lipid transport [Nitrosospira sp. Nsp11]|uniref:SRPBCC family protein n=1 Tax=Nitrosospira sp. Nsp11 TaxID=1855338 RepID=UPI000923A57F|nr:SRPBCC family protein [Nitrosospira sp. Nsp11]SHL89450.1 Polyketide cyclase / dehydrase and lipid transport [Nitrosospira sp. Nsp11]
MRRIVAFAAAAVFAATPAQAFDVKSPGPDWTEAYHTSELTIFIKDVDEGRRIVATTEVVARPEIIFDVLSDFEHYPDFMPYVKESRVLGRESNGEVITYARVAPPFVSERDYLLRVRMVRGTASNTGVFKIEWKAIPEMQPEVEGVVRIKLNEGSWLAAPLDGGTRTRLTYTLLTNPGGLIPDFVANMSNTIAIPELFKAVGKRSVQEAKAKEE